MLMTAGYTGGMSVVLHQNTVDVKCVIVAILQRGNQRNQENV